MHEIFERYLYQNAFPSKLPKTIYHYTTQTGMLGIIREGEMWATQVHFLNDRNEINLTFKLLNKKLTAYMNNSTCQTNKSVLTKIRKLLHKIDQGHICVASFCEKGDLLSQWRGYGNLGKGYSIGFDLKRLNLLARKNSFVIWPCIYEETLQNELVEYLVESWCKSLNDKNYCEKEMLRIIDKDVCLLAPIIKDASFSEEKEWRLISSTIPQTPHQMDFRAGEYSLIPYTKLPVINEKGSHCIKEIVVGPSPHIMLAENSLRSFLNSNRILSTKIIRSVIPFRDWK